MENITEGFVCAEGRIMDCEQITKLTEAINMLSNNVVSTNTRLQELTNSVNDMSRQINSLKEEMNELKNENQEMKGIIVRQDNNIKQLMRDVRKRNLVFHGLARNSDEAHSDVIDLIRNKLGVSIPENQVVEVQNMGANKNILLVTFLTESMRNSVIRNKNRLRDTEIYISEHFSREVLQERKILLPLFKEAKARGLNASFRYNYVEVDGNEYRVNDVERLKTLVFRHTTLRPGYLHSEADTSSESDKNIVGQSQRAAPELKKRKRMAKGNNSGKSTTIKEYFAGTSQSTTQKTRTESL